MKTRFKTLAAAAILALAACREDGDDETLPPTAGQKAQVQQADSASGSMAGVNEAANDAIVDSGSGGAATSSKSGKSYAASTINYQANLDLTIDLDAVDGNGNDLHPNATGVIHVVASGSIVGDPSAGEANYAVSVSATTAVTATDPVCGVTATLAAGAIYSYTLEITWSHTDSQNWTISAACDASLQDYDLTVSKGAEWVNVRIDWEKHGTVTFKAVAGVFTASASGSESGTVEITDSTGTHVVYMSQVSGSWMVTVDGQGFGPYTEAQLEATFNIVIE